MEKHKYSDAKLSVLPDLYAAVILGKVFKVKHKSICGKFGRKKPSLSVQMDYFPQQLFPNLAENCKLIAVKSRKYSKQDKEFIATEENRLLSKGSPVHLLGKSRS